MLAIPYAFKSWKKVVLLATAFTLGHSLTLALSALKLISVNAQIIEILIAVTILITAVLNLRNKEESKMSLRYLMAVIFGLIHGLGFSNFFKSIVGPDAITVPLLAFNIGVELAQVIIVLMVLVASWILVEKLKIKHKYLIYAVSIIVAVMSLSMVIERI